MTSGATIVGDGVLARRKGSNVVFCEFPPFFVVDSEAGKEGSSSPGDQPHNVRRTFRRASFLLARLLANMGVAAPTPLLSRFHEPLDPTRNEKRWLDAFYLDHPVEWDDPYRFFNW